MSDYKRFSIHRVCQTVNSHIVAVQVLEELEPDKSLAKFREQYEIILQAVRRSHGESFLLRRVVRQV